MNNDNTYNSISTTPSAFGTREFLESNSLIANNCNYLKPFLTFVNKLFELFKLFRVII